LIRKVIGVSAAALAVFAVTACSNGNDSEAPTATSIPAASTATVAAPTATAAAPAATPTAAALNTPAATATGTPAPSGTPGAESGAAAFTAVDHSFAGPDTIPAGVTEFTLTNGGQEPHHM